MPANMIDVGPNVPRRRNAFLRGLGSIVLKLAGWKVTGKVADEPRFVLTGGPHTSNWDFIFALMTLWKLELDVHWIGKHTIFRWPFRSLFTYFGGIPVDRRKPGTLFRDVLQGFSGNRPFIFALSPEGTGPRWSASNLASIGSHERPTFRFFRLEWTSGRKKSISGN